MLFIHPEVVFSFLFLKVVIIFSNWVKKLGLILGEGAWLGKITLMTWRVSACALEPHCLY